MPLPLGLIAAGLSAGSTIYTMLNKPKKPNITNQTNTLNKIIANNQSDIVGKNYYNSLMNSQKSLGAQQYQNAQANLEAMNAGGQLSDAQLAEGVIKANTQTQGMLNQASGQAMAQQINMNRESKSRIEQARMNLAQLKDQARQQYQADTQQWKNEVAGGVADTFSTAMSAYASKLKSDKLKALIPANTDWANMTDEQLNGLYMKLLVSQIGG